MRSQGVELTLEAARGQHSDFRCKLFAIQHSEVNRHSIRE